MLPGIAGEEVRTKVKGQVKVIILSAKSSIGDRVGNLLNGANDFISKPFDNDELLARIEVQLRDIEPKTEHISNGELRIEPEQRLAFVGKQQLKLTKIEYDILAFFMKHPNQVFSKNQIFEQVWDYNAIGNEESVKVHISNLRNKISIYTETKYIDTVWGIGFRFIPS